MPRLAKAAAACLIIGGVLAAFVFVTRRSASEEAPITTNLSDDSLVVGVVANIGGDEEGREYLRGVRLWEQQLNAAGGIPYDPTRLAAVDVRVADDQGSVRGAARAAERLIKSGVTSLFGPLAPAELEAVSIVAARHRVALLSPINRPASVPRRPLFTFLNPPHVGDFLGVLDAYAALSKTRSPRVRPASVRVAVVAPTGRWALEGRTTVALAKQRGYKSHLFRVGEAAEQFAAAMAFRPDMVLVSAPYELGRKWAEFYKGNTPAIWAIAAAEVRDVQTLPPPASVVVAVPWFPTAEWGGVAFPPGRFSEMYRDAYGRTPTSPAAAGAALGELLAGMVRTAKSTDTSRILAARDRLEMGSHFGSLTFDHGEQAAISPFAMRATGRGVRPIWPSPATPELLAPEEQR